MRIPRTAIALMMTWALALLTDTWAATPPPGSQAVAPDAASLAKRLSKLEKEVNELSMRVLKNEMTSALDDMRFTSAEFDPSESKFQRIDTSLGSFAVSIQNVEPFADGIRVTLNLGNLSSARFNGATLNLRYGARNNIQVTDADSSSKFSAWFASLQSKDIDITDSLLPGNWNPVEIVLPSIEPKEFGYLEVKIKTNTISLR